RGREHDGARHRGGEAIERHREPARQQRRAGGLAVASRACGRLPDLQLLVAKGPLVGSHVAQAAAADAKRSRGKLGWTPSLPRAPGWTHHSLCRGQLLLAGLGRFALGAHPVDEDRDGDIDGAVSTAQEAYDEGAGKAMQTLAAQDVKD